MHDLFAENYEWAAAFAGWLFREFSYSSLERDDYTQEAMLGFLDAVAKYDESFHTKFRTYAGIRMRGAIVDWQRRQDVLSRHERELWREQQLMLVEGVKVPHRELVIVPSILSLNFVTGDEGRHHEHLDLLVADVVDEIDLDIEARVRIAISQLPERYAMCIVLRYYEGMTMKAIGDFFDVTESRASQIHSKALLKLRDLLRTMESEAA